MRLRISRCRPLPVRVLLCLLFVIALAIYCLYYNSSLPVVRKQNVAERQFVGGMVMDLKEPAAYFDESFRRGSDDPEQCPVLKESVADIDTVSTYSQFDFQPSWMRSKEFWDKSFEDRYERMKNDSRRPKLHVILVPHSHNDPGWLKTFEQYFEWKTKNIITHMVKKLNQYPNMTFIWTEISFLNSWWERSHPVKQKQLKRLVKEGRLEITSGGWVMPDEACTHIYALIDQFIEGHQWVKSKLGISPKTGWSIDPFGHGPTVPHLLDQSGLQGTVIQRIHYAWKQWLAHKQIEEFYWLPGWATNKPSMVVHNAPFDIYSIKSTCGPHPAICLSYDFRRIPGEYSEYTAKYEEVTDQNVHARAKTLIEEYDRIGSLTPHNVALVPLGDDFRYEYEAEFDAQYANYIKMFDYINSHQELFNADVRFGTLNDYFKEVKKRHKNIPTLKGDFFVYSDIFTEGKPAYWSGYYTTRPYLKIVTRQLESQLRTAEILFTLVSNYIRQQENKQLVESEKRLEKFYEQLIIARRNLGLFQHHDAVTGTSKAAVMYDYATKMFTSIYHCMRLQEAALATVMIPDVRLHSQSVLQSESEWETYGKPVRKLHVSYVDRNQIIVFNSLMEMRTEVVTVRSNTTNVRVYDTYRKEYVLYQISPNMEAQSDGRHVLSTSTFDVMFVARLPPLTAVTYRLHEHANRSHHAFVYCNHCANKDNGDTVQIFPTKPMMAGDIQLENSVMKLLINRNTGLLRHIYRKDLKKKNIVDMQFGAYQSAQRHSGAYLFMPDYDAPEKPVLTPYAWNNEDDDNIIIVSGLIATEITTLYLPFLIHTVRIFNVEDPALSRAVYIENVVDFESPPKNRETELFMRLQTDIQNGNIPEFYTDQNGFQYQKRVKINNLGIEGNYYPITTMAWLQDEESRLTLVTSHAQGAAASEPGRIELMLDRRSLYDDLRGLGEGVVDNKPTVFQNWLILEATPAAAEGSRGQYQVPSETAGFLSRALNYPPHVYVVDSSEAGGTGEVAVATHRAFASALPGGLHLVTLRTMTDPVLEQFPSRTCLMVLQRPGRACAEPPALPADHRFSPRSRFLGLNVTHLAAVSLTGLDTRHTLAGLHDIQLQPMDVKTYKITF